MVKEEEKQNLYYTLWRMMIVLNAVKDATLQFLFINKNSEPKPLYARYITSLFYLFSINNSI
jgi:hypothetical protein